MKVIRRIVVGIAGVIIVALAIELAAPKAVHAIVSTLVTVVNTPSNPGATEDISKSASQIVELSCAVTIERAFQDCDEIIADGSDGGRYKVPTGENFVITSIDFGPTFPGSGGLIGVTLLQEGNGISNNRESWSISNSDGNTTQLLFPTSGIVIAAGSVLGIELISGTGVTVEIHGYQTAN